LKTDLTFRSRPGVVPTAAERAVIEDAITEIREFDARQIVTRDGVPLTESTFLVEGLVSRNVDGRDGGRQLVAIQVPGDFVDLHGYPLKSLDHDVGTLTRVRLAVIPHSALDDIQQRHPALAYKLWFLTLIDASMHRQWIFRLGRLSAIKAVAHFLCEMSLRMMAIDRFDGSRFALPLNQTDVADVCGLTHVHVNRVVRQLRDRGLCTFRQGQVEIHDLGAFVELAEFDARYLYYDDVLLERFRAAAASPSSGQAPAPAP
jgi:CRP-like cAMP-binding protein